MQNRIQFLLRTSDMSVLGAFAWGTLSPRAVLLKQPMENLKGLYHVDNISTAMPSGKETEVTLHQPSSRRSWTNRQSDFGHRPHHKMTVQAKKRDAVYKLHLALSEEAYSLFQMVVAFLEADSEAEALRRSIRSLDFIEPTNLPNSSRGLTKKGDKKVHIYFEPDARTKKRLEGFREDYGWSYTKTVLAGICVLAELYKQSAEDASASDVNLLTAVL
ncbi:MAG: hypothetical protein AAGI89_08785 [Pseudomonadota bacterium]